MASTVGALRYDTTGLARGEAFETFTGRGWPGFAGAFAVSGDVNGFFYRSTIVPAGRLSVYRFHISGMNYARDAGQLRDGRDHILIQANHAGGSSGVRDGHAYDSGPRSVGVVDFARPLVQTTRETRAACLLLDRSLLQGVDIDALAGFRWRTGGATLFADYLQQLIGRIEGAPISAIPRLERSAMAMLLACKGHGADALEEARPELQSLAAARARRFVAANLQSVRLTPERIAAAAGVSRATLYRLFSQEGGVARFVMRERLGAALAMLSDPADRRPVTAIAQACGFADTAHFSRAFKESVGVRPTDYRPLN